MLRRDNGSSQTINRAFRLAVFFNAIFVVIQIISAQIANSSSLLADAVHNLGDVLSLLLAWLGNSLLNKQPTINRTYGLKKASILAALANVLLLVFSALFIFVDAIPRFIRPHGIDSALVIAIASLGIVVNFLSALLFRSYGSDLNIKAAYLHLLADAAVSLGVVLGAIFYVYFGWIWLDPLVAVMIALLIVKSSYSVLVASVRLILDCVPQGISLVAVKQLLQSLDGVSDVHNLHIWALSTRENALSVHLVMPNSSLPDIERHALQQRLQCEFNINHITIQIEKDPKYCAIK